MSTRVFGEFTVRNAESRSRNVLTVCSPSKELTVAIELASFSTDRKHISMRVSSLAGAVSGSPHSRFWTRSRIMPSPRRMAIASEIAIW